MIPRYIQWTKKEDERLILFFNKHIQFYGARWHGNLHNRIMRDMKKCGFDRSEKAVARRCFRLGLKAYTVKKGEEIYKCAECSQPYIIGKRYVEREKNKNIYCKKCAEKHRHDWNIKNREAVLRYYQAYNKAHTQRRMTLQKIRRTLIQ